MPNLRTAIQDFATANKIYVNATVTFYTVDDGAKTTTLATLYRDTIGDIKLPNPQTLDSNGKFRVPVYIEDAVIAVVSGLGNTPAHETGVIPGGDWFAQAENAAAEAIAAKEDAEDAAVSALDSKNLAEDWARKTDGLVEATDYSAKAWSVGGTGVTDGDGAAKEWATKTGGTVDGSDYSAKHYANNADASAFAAGISETHAGNSAAAALISENNASASEIAAGISETNAGNSAAAALVSENNAAASEISAAGSAARLVGTSASSVVIGGGSKSFTTQAGKLFNPGTFLMVTSDAAPSTNYMFGQVTSYSGTALQMNMLSFGGAGTYDDWTITVSGARGPSGAGAEADDVSYDNSTSGLSAVNVQDALDEIDSYLGSLTGSLGTMAGQSASSVNITGGSVTGITDLAVADGGTGASDASGARTSLGLVIGTDVQAYNANLASLAGITLQQGDLLYATGANTLTRLAKGTALQQLQMNSGATAPEWADPAGASKTLVVFEGNGTISTNQTILRAENVSSVFKNAAGDYTINFTSAFPNANYVISGSAVIATSDTSRVGTVGIRGDTAPSTTSVRILTGGIGSGGVVPQDAVRVMVSVV